ncbi:MAG: undecaprenyl-diphosphatase [Gammaproteobacteria bacterium]|nr:MAG: undecaprenyl-diphosphatase [Gammaproteobacteria bacterium]
MDRVQLVALALLQGLTEFLPVSSSAHLILLPRLLGWPDQGLALDIAVHAGSLLAVCVYFRADLRALAAGAAAALAGRPTPEGRLAGALLLASVPVGVAGLLGKEAVETVLRSERVIAAATFVFALWLAWAWRRRPRPGRDTVGWREAWWIGCAQVLALIPGASRSGVTLAAGLAAGLAPQAAARFSFLLSIPVITAAGGLQAVELAAQPAPVAWGDLALAMGLAALAAAAAIHLFLGALARIGLMPFVWYRIALAAWLAWLYR